MITSKIFVSAFCLALVAFVSNGTWASSHYEVKISDPVPKSMIAFNHDRTESIEIFRTPCLLKLPDEIPQDVKDQMQAAKSMTNGKYYQACWVSVYPYVYFIDEEGDTGRVSIELFKQGSEI